MSITNRSAKAKGMRLQSWIAEKLGILLGVTYGTDDDAWIRPRPSAQHGTDIIFRPEVAFPWAIEAKSVETLRLFEAIKQAKANAGEKRWLIVAKRKALKTPIVVMSWESFEYVLTALYGER